MENVTEVFSESVEVGNGVTIIIETKHFIKIFKNILRKFILFIMKINRNYRKKEKKI